MDKKVLIESFEAMLQISCNEGKLYPYPAAGLEPDGKMNIISFMVPPEEVMLGAINMIKKKGFTEIAFGLDRTSEPSQGVDEKYDSVYTIWHLKEGAWRYGVFPYNKNGEYGPIDWENTFWIEQLKGEITRLRFPHLEIV